MSKNTRSTLTTNPSWHNLQIFISQYRLCLTVPSNYVARILITESVRSNQYVLLARMSFKALEWKPKHSLIQSLRAYHPLILHSTFHIPHNAFQLKRESVTFSTKKPKNSLTVCNAMQHDFDYYVIPMVVNRQEVRTTKTNQFGVWVFLNKKKHKNKTC